MSLADQVRALLSSVDLGAVLEGDRISNRTSKDLKSDPLLAAEFHAYLTNPYSNGYWQLSGTWNITAPLILYILEKVGTLNKSGARPEHKKHSANSERLSVTKIEELNIITTRLSSITQLFQAVVANDREEEVSFTDHYAWIKKLDLKEIQSEFAEAYRVFSDEIYIDGVTGTISRNILFKFAKGAVFSSGIDPSENFSFSVFGMREKDIRAIANFLTALELLDAVKVERVFAPDEALFKPYFLVVSMILPNIIDDKKISHVFDKALDYYLERDFQHCISTLGLIAEDYLQRIYVALLREQSPGGLTLGQILDRLHKRINEMFSTEKNQLGNVDDFFKKISAMEDAVPADQVRALLRDLANLIKGDRGYFKKKIEEIGKPPARHTPFPAHINDGLNELLKWRNAASHNSRIPLGVYEADRTLYCLVIFINWWLTESAKLDWSQDKEDLVKVLVSSASVN